MSQHTHRKSNMNWEIKPNANGNHDVTIAQLAVLMDIREELKLIKAALAPLQRLNCSDFMFLHRELKRIRINTDRLRKPRKKKEAA